MLRAYKYRLYPTPKQAELINKSIDGCRLVYNLGLEIKNVSYKQHGKNISAYDLMQQLPELKEECIWLKDIDSQALQQSLLDLEDGFKNFFKKKSKYPVFHSKKRSSQSFRNPHGKRVTIADNKLHQAKFKEGIKIKIDRPFEGEIRNTVISRTPTNKYFVSVMTEDFKEIPIKSQIKANTAIGIDLGIKDFIITSNSGKIDNPKYLKASIDRLKILQRRLRNKQKGSVNKKKAYYRVALLHERVTNQRKDFLHKLSTKLVSDNQTICLEDLNVSGMVKNHKLARSISDASWSRFVDMIKYKSVWNGGNVLQIPRFEPSTKVCNECSTINNGLTLSDRIWTCICGVTHDRDINAAINIKNYCIRNSGQGMSGEPVEMLAIVKSKKQEVKSMPLKRDETLPSPMKTILTNQPIKP